ncbi:hypothetical protein Tco_0513804 [Tanacetum coccineum]
MPSAKTHNTPNACTPKPRSNKQKSRNWPASKSCEETLKAMQKADHSRNPSSFSDFKHFVCSTCQKCVFNANHDACITKYLKEVNSRAKIQPNKTKNSNKPVDSTSHTQKPSRKIITGHSFSLNKSSAVHEKTNTPRSYLRWIPTGRILTLLVLNGFQLERHSHLAQQRLIVNSQMVQMIISLTLINAIKLSMSVQELMYDEQGQWLLITSDQHSCFMIMASVDNTSGPVPQRKERFLERVNCVLQISGLYTLRLLDAACKKVLNLLKKGLLV